MVGHHHEFLATILARERLRQRYPAALAERATFQHRRFAARIHAVAAVDQADPDAVLARAVAGIDEAPVAAVGIEGVHQCGQAGVRAVAVVLQFHQRHHVRIQAAQGGDQFGQLRVQRLRAARTAFGREAAAVAVAIEQVFQVERGHAHLAGYLRRCRARAGLDRHRGIHLQPPAAVVALDHAFGTTHGVADPRRGASIQPGHLRRVALAAAIVQQQALAGVVGHLCGVFGRARAGDLAGMPLAAVEGQRQFAKAVDRVGAGHGQRCVDAHAHAFQRLPVRGQSGQHRHRDRDAVALGLGLGLGLAEVVQAGGSLAGQRGRAGQQDQERQAATGGQDRHGGSGLLKRQRRPEAALAEGDRLT